MGIDDALSCVEEKTVVVVVVVVRVLALDTDDDGMGGVVAKAEARSRILLLLPVQRNSIHIGKSIDLKYMTCCTSGFVRMNEWWLLFGRR